MKINKILEIMRYLTMNTDIMTDVKLMKMMYLADRQSLLESGYTISEDDFYSMNRGPILSNALNLINLSHEQFLEYFLNPIEQNNPSDSTYTSVKTIELIESREFELFELSEYEVSILDEIIQKYSHMTTDEIVKFSHDFLPEWNYPHGSSELISYEKILLSGKISENNIPGIISEINYFKSLEAV